MHASMLSHEAIKQRYRDVLGTMDVAAADPGMHQAPRQQYANSSCVNVSPFGACPAAVASVTSHLQSLLCCPQRTCCFQDSADVRLDPWRHSKPKSGRHFYKRFTPLPCDAPTAACEPAAAACNGWTVAPASLFIAGPAPVLAAGMLLATPLHQGGVNEGKLNPGAGVIGHSAKP